MLLVMDTREEHILLGAVTIDLLLAEFLVAVGLTVGSLYLGGILHRSLLGGGLQGAFTAGLVHDVAVERTTVEQRGLTVLLTAQVLGQGKRVVGRVLVQRCVL